jgi:hypothetical protein
MNKKNKMDLITPGVGLILLSIVSLFAIILPIICLISILKNDFKNNDKLIWVIVVIFIPILGSILYLLIGRKKRLDHKQ